MQGKKLPKHSGAVRLLIDTAPASKGTWMCLIQIKAVVRVLWRTRLCRGPCDRDPSGYLLRENPWLRLQGGGASYNTTSRTAAKTGPS